MMKEQITAVTQMRYGQADRVKMGRKDFQKDMESTNLFGIVYLAEKILKEHQENPFKTSDEIIGEIHKELVIAWNQLALKWPKTTGRIDLQRLMDTYGPKENKTEIV